MTVRTKVTNQTKLQSLPRGETNPLVVVSHNGIGVDLHRNPLVGKDSKILSVIPESRETFRMCQYRVIPGVSETPDTAEDIPEICAWLKLRQHDPGTSHRENNAVPEAPSSCSVVLDVYFRAKTKRIIRDGPAQG